MGLDNGQTVVTIDAGSANDAGDIVVTIDAGGPMENGDIVVMIGDEMEAEPFEPYSRAVVLDIHINNLFWGYPYTLNLLAGTYRITPTGGAVEDGAGDGSWTWHMRSSAGDINSGYSCEGNVWAIDSPGTALNAAIGMRLEFNWPGGPFEMWIPTDEQYDNNQGTLSVLVERIA